MGGVGGWIVGDPHASIVPCLPRSNWRYTWSEGLCLRQRSASLEVLTFGVLALGVVTAAGTEVAHLKTHAEPAPGSGPGCPTQRDPQTPQLDREPDNQPGDHPHASVDERLELVVPPKRSSTPKLGLYVKAPLWAGLG